MMDRRCFLLTTLAAALAALPPASEAQQARKIARIAVLVPTSDPRPLLDVFEQSLRAFGWIKGQTIMIETRSPTMGPEAALAPAVTELLGIGADVLVVWGTVAALAAKQATEQIPVVFLATGDPVSLGLVASLARPGGNLTGVPAIASSEEFAKRLALLKEAVPSVARVALLVGPDGGALLNLNRGPMAAAAMSLKLELREVRVETPRELETAVRQAKRQGAQALYIWPSGFTLAYGKQLSDLALTVRLPSVHPFTESAVAGGLFSYSASLRHIAQRGAVYVDKILRGAKASDLPVEAPTRFELVINLKTAMALGLTIPPSLLARADQVIDP